MTKDELQDIVAAFYKQALTVNTATTPADVLERILAANFQSINSQGAKDKATLMQQVSGFWKLIPNLVWEPQDLVNGEDGKTVVVRSVASGSPKGNFRGVDCDGIKSFKIDTIDIHTIENEQIVHVYHVEDWMTAMQQLRA
jgi:predicted ester cyclase